MPNPNIAPPPTQQQAQMMRRALGEPLQQIDLVNEVSMLRSEIAALREELRPVPSMIATGREVLDEFKRLRS